jgi:tRNA1Val (adenine37-N6)-methyltransferase
MANDYFQFRRFTVRQSLCAMKVGTDGTLLGAWASGGRHILDVGTGTGLIALMMAQRYPEARVTGIDIDDGAVLQARANVEASPFADRIEIMACDVNHMAGMFDSIVCNPPFFIDALESPDPQRTMARHAATLSYTMLMHRAWRLLSEDGELSVVIPSDCRSRLESEAFLAGFFKSRDCAVRTTPTKQPKRFLMAFRKHPSAIEREELTIGSAEYQELTKDFYL